ncbi:hypothetical protein EI546_11515 [Aequorivita sp. H23M31]|uniref:Uncharacterized protein n=1 Tax=Aequorivita ciconiae TaxID=2494375 RepID=A0A410G4W5_9FLAO|nr:hypothetical protein [Aequorivita sp. H23M31]QAA82306.1 hypothetical protein EI546_11515 [Aequorivita sp. H23M31]
MRNVSFGSQWWGIGGITANVSCMSSGVGWHELLQTVTCQRKIRRIFQVGGKKPLLIASMKKQRVSYL